MARPRLGESKRRRRTIGVRVTEAEETELRARMMVLCSLPRTNPGNRHQYKRVNGPFTLIMFSSSATKLPFGNLPRLLLAWLCTEAVRTQSRVLILGSSLSDFMDKLRHGSRGSKPLPRASYAFTTAL